MENSVEKLRKSGEDKTCFRLSFLKIDNKNAYFGA